MPGVPDSEVSTLAGEQIVQPVPGGGRLDDRPPRAGATVEGREVERDRLAPGRELHVAHGTSVRVDGRDDDGPLVQVDMP